jgi:hypothetical protein
MVHKVSCKRLSMIKEDFVAIIPYFGIVIVCRKTAFEKIDQILFYARVSSFRPLLEPCSCDVFLLIDCTPFLYHFHTKYRYHGLPRAALIRLEVMTHSLPVFVIFLELTMIGPMPCVLGVVLGANPVEESDCCLWQFMIVILIWRCWPCYWHC